LYFSPVAGTVGGHGTTQDVGAGALRDYLLAEQNRHGTSGKLAKALGRTKGSISMLLSGERPVTEDTLQAIADLKGIDAVQLFGEIATYLIGRETGRIPAPVPPRPPSRSGVAEPRRKPR
jgi:transcriptional regulator with XRE-family HTH domain